MKLYSLFDENHILIGQDVSTLEDALRLMLRNFGDLFEREVADKLVADLIQRELTHPTEIDPGVAVPHMRLEWLDRFLVGLLTPSRPLKHPNPEKEPISLILMILAPQNKNAMMLQTLAAFARLLSSHEAKHALLRVKAPGRVLRIMEETGIDVKKTLVAADIMSEVPPVVTLDTILVKAVDALTDSPDEGVPVLNDQNKLVGELTSRELLTLGMPKYLDLIANPSMLDHFEPFENFFRHENTMRVREVCRRNVAVVGPGAPVVQVAHLMMTRQRRRVYVVNEDELMGVIYRKNIITRVLHF